jgi:hypothetical protein
MKVTDLKELDLLVLRQDILGGLSPVWRVFPAVLDQAVGMLVLLGAGLAGVDLASLLCTVLRQTSCLIAWCGRHSTVGSAFGARVWDAHRDSNGRHRGWNDVGRG